MSTYKIEGSHVVGEFPKNKRSHVIAYLTDYEGSRIAHLRVREGTYLSKNGFTVQLNQLPELLKLVEALQERADEEAKVPANQSETETDGEAA